MDSEISMNISIPADDDGYVKLQCEHCGTYFKITPADIQNDSVLQIFCPCCGLTSDNYYTEDVEELAAAMIENMAMDMLYDEMKKLERQSRKSIVQFKAGPRPNHVPEIPVHSGIDDLEITDFPCCQRTAKIKPLLRLTGCYCPFCGVIDYDIEYE